MASFCTHGVAHKKQQNKTNPNKLAYCNSYFPSTEQFYSHVNRARTKIKRIGFHYTVGKIITMSSQFFKHKKYLINKMFKRGMRHNDALNKSQTVNTHSCSNSGRLAALTNVC